MHVECFKQCLAHNKGSINVSYSDCYYSFQLFSQMPGKSPQKGMELTKQNSGKNAKVSKTVIQAKHTLLHPLSIFSFLLVSRSLL